MAEELVPVAICQALAAIEGLRKGRSDARETQRVGPVDDTVIEATLPHLPPTAADMVRFQRLTGCRPGEVCDLRPCDLDRDGEVSSYRPANHKLEHRELQRVIFIGPKAQAVLMPYLARNGRLLFFAGGK